MGITLNFKTGKPPYKGYYLVRSKLTMKYGAYPIRNKYPEPMYWNGDSWQMISDDEAFDAPGNYTPTKYGIKDYEEWCEVDV